MDSCTITEKLVYVPNKTSNLAYEAKITKKNSMVMAKVHCTGWNKRYDEWVGNELLLKVPTKEHDRQNPSKFKKVIDLIIQKLQKVCLPVKQPGHESPIGASASSHCPKKNGKGRKGVMSKTKNHGAKNILSQEAANDTK